MLTVDCHMNVQKIPNNHQCKNVSKGKWQHFQLNDEPGLATEVGTKTRTSSATPRRSRNRVAQSCDMRCTFDVVCFWVSAGSHRFRLTNYCIHSGCSWFVLQDAARIEENLILFDLFDLLLTVLYSIIYCIMFIFWLFTGPLILSDLQGRKDRQSEFSEGWWWRQREVVLFRRVSNSRLQILHRCTDVLAQVYTPCNMIWIDLISHTYLIIN